MHWLGVASGQGSGAGTVRGLGLRCTVRCRAQLRAMDGRLTIKLEESPARKTSF
jgi:hypothetical protein